MSQRCLCQKESYAQDDERHTQVDNAGETRSKDTNFGLCGVGQSNDSAETRAVCVGDEVSLIHREGRSAESDVEIGFR